MHKRSRCYNIFDTRVCFWTYFWLHEGLIRTYFRMQRKCQIWSVLYTICHFFWRFLEFTSKVRRRNLNIFFSSFLKKVTVIPPKCTIHKNNFNFNQWFHNKLLFKTFNFLFSWSLFGFYRIRVLATVKYSPVNTRGLK